jgi:hypothetical protein
MEGFHKYNKIKAIGHEENKDIFQNPEDEIIIEEKIDGGNFRFMIKDGKIILGSRTQEIDEKAEGKHLKNFRRCCEYVREILQDKDLKLLEKRIFYGECCIKHTLSYDWDSIPPFLGFDIYCLENNKYLSNKKMFFEGLGFKTVPEIKICKSSEIKELTDTDVPVSVYAPRSNPKQQAEGIVLKNYKTQIFAKYVREQFKEKARDTFGGTVKYEETDDGKIVAKYCTNARIDKCIFKLVDEGHKLEMAMMKELPKFVYKDIMEEEWQEVVFSNYEVNFRNIRKLVTKRCLAVLKQVMVNNAISEKTSKKTGDKVDNR